MIAPEIFTPEYYERLRALEAGGWWNAAMRDILASALDGAALPAQGVLLDVGCGTGGTLAWFHGRYQGWRCVGVDVAPDGLRAVPRLPRVAAAMASALALPVRSASVDVVICLDVLQHLPLDGGDATALREIRRVLKPGGTLFLRTNAQSVPRASDDIEFQFHKYETPELRRKLEGAGFVIERLGRVNALLGLAEIPRELRAHGRTGRSYHGIMAVPRQSPLDRVKKWWLSLEGRLVLSGASLPLGRTHLARCRSARGNGTE